MSSIDKAKDKIAAAKGKEAADKAGDQQSVEAEARGDQVARGLRQAGEQVKDASKESSGAVT